MCPQRSEGENNLQQHEDYNLGNDPKQTSDNRIVVQGQLLPRMDRIRRKQTLKQVITAKQEKIYAQQCEIDELRQRIRAICSDNKFLREQNYWQAKALEKLDGKHAELPQIINGHLEEIRVFREQLRRIKDVLKLEKQRRQEAELANERASSELKHLRSLAEKQNLLEREELMQTIAKLQQETEERGRMLSNLEKYAENLEKNQRFESMRHGKVQKELKETCQSLLDRIQLLEQTVKEKQKIIELKNIYSNRMYKSQLTPRRPSSGQNSIGSENPCSLQTDIGVKKTSARITSSLLGTKKSGTEKVAPTNRSDNLLQRLTETIQPSDTRTGKEEIVHPDPIQSKGDCAPGFHREVVVLPKIEQNASMFGSGQNNLSPVDATAPPALAHPSETMFEELRRREREARVVAEKCLTEECKNSNEDGIFAHWWPKETPNSGTHQSGTGQLPVILKDPRQSSRIQENTAPNPVYKSAENRDQPLDKQGCSEFGAYPVPPDLNSPQLSRTPSEFSSYGSSTLIPLQATMDNICRPCGDQDIDEFFTGDTSGGSSPDMSDENFMWQQAPTTTRAIPAVGNPQPLGLPNNTAIPLEPAAEIVQAKDRDGTSKTKTSLPAIHCDVRTKTLYTMNPKAKR